ncbi:hypothetical protein MMC07_001665 [Pseudocyphellaria aurata]|nr:hypothetical protein [Pseudocyphellaria aurata]
MMFVATALFQSLLVSFVLAGSSIATRASVGASGVYTQCYTRQVSTQASTCSAKSKAFSTSYTTVSETVTLVAAVTTTPVKTVTPSKAVTITEPVNTLTITEVATRTNTITTTSTATATATATTTTTVMGDPVVIPAAQDFQRVIDTLGGAMLKKRDDARPRALEAEDGKDLVPRTQSNSRSCTQSISCTVFKTVYKTVVVYKTCSATKTVTARAATSIVFSTSTKTITATVLKTPAPTTTTVTATIFSSSTASVVTTTTTTTTVTATVSQPASTSYAACDRPNLIGTVNQRGIIRTGPRGQFTIGDSVTRTATAYDCCVACLRDPVCAASAFTLALQACRVYQIEGVPRCSGQADSSYVAYYSNNAPPNNDIVISNGNCGTYNLATDNDAGGDI